MITRPGGVVGERSWVPGRMLPVLGNALRVDRLARVSVDADGQLDEGADNGKWLDEKEGLGATETGEVLR